MIGYVCGRHNILTLNQEADAKSLSCYRMKLLIDSFTFNLNTRVKGYSLSLLT